MSAPPDPPAAERTVTVTRLVHAPRAAVYRALLDPEAVAIWRVPPSMSAVVHELDPREGGTFRISLTYATSGRVGKSAGATDTCRGRFTRLEPDTMVREVIEFETKDPRLRGPFTITTVLADAPGGTRVDITHEGLPPGVALADERRGTAEALEQLARLVEAAVDHPPHEVRCFLVTTVHGAAWDEGKPIRSQDGWDAHATFLDQLVEEGFVLLGGPLDDGVHAVLVVAADSEEDVRRRFAADPWAPTGILRLESVRQWQIWLGTLVR